LSNNQENTYVIDSESGAEMARLTDQDRLFTEAAGSLFPPDLDLASISRVLDVACGPGGWGLEVAYRHPEIDVVGLDISQIMIQYANAQATVQHLSNAHFQVGDVLKPLPFDTGSFDVVNARFMVSFMPNAGWPRVVGELVRILRPGGMICLTEVDNWGMSTSQSLEQMKSLVYLAVALDGRSFEPEGRHLGITPMLRGFLQEARCHQIRVQAAVLNSSSGMKAYEGAYRNFQFLLQLIQPFLLKMQVATQEELNTLYEQTLIEMLSADYRALWYFLRVWANKPEA
jgi:ubiquinone/menaquinone biosynthesis C-methylase UbiE